MPSAEAPQLRTAPRPSTPVSGAVVELHVEADIAAGLTRWRALENQLAATRDQAAGSDEGSAPGGFPHPYACSADWTETWLKYYGDICPHRILIGIVRHEAGEQVIGIALVSQSRLRKGPFVLRFWHLGTAGEPEGHSVCVEYNRVFAEPEWWNQFESEVVYWLKTHGRDGVALDGLAPDEWAGLAPQFPGTKVRTASSKYFDLTRARVAGTDVLSQLGRSTRQNLRRKLRDYGDIETTWAEDVPTALSILDELIELHQARWNAVGKPGAFSSPRFAAFQRDLLTRWIPERRIVAFRTRHQGETVGCLVLLVDQGRILDYYSGFVSFDRKPSPGMVTHLLCMQEALARGYSAYDFLVGEKQHKDNLSTDETQLVWGIWQPDTWKLRAYHAVRSLKYSALRLLGRDSAEGAAGAASSPADRAKQETVAIAAETDQPVERSCQ